MSTLAVGMLPAMTRHAHGKRGHGTLRPLPTAYCLLPTAYCLLLTALCGTASAQDSITVTRGDGRTKLTGQIQEYLGGKLQFETIGGRVDVFTSEQLVDIQTPRNARHVQADGLFAQRRFQQAAELYRLARGDESRAWVRRQITAQIVWCFRALDRPDRAGAEFLLIVREDPQTAYFDCIPLVWTSQQPSPTLEQAAQAWIRRNEPAAVLLGASHLLSTGSRADALRRLRQLELAAGADRRVALLAMAQSWRAETVTASPQRIESWASAIEQIPESLAAGPYFVLGNARLRQPDRAQWERAALALMRVAILHTSDRALAAESLLRAGEALKKLGQDNEAARVLRELAESYGDTRAAAELRGRVD